MCKRLGDELSGQQHADAERLVAGLQREDDPLLRALANAPEDDEPLTPEEEAAIEEAYAEIAAGRTMPDEEFRRRLNDEPAR